VIKVRFRAWRNDICLDYVIFKYKFIFRLYHLFYIRKFVIEN